MSAENKVPAIRFKGFSGAWEESAFKERCWFQEGPGLRHWQFTNKGIKVINVTNLENGVLNLAKTDRHISLDEFFKIYKHFEVDENDIVVASSGNSYGKVAIVRKQDLPLLMNTSVIRFKPLKYLDFHYLLTFIKSNQFKDQIDLLITGGAQPNFGPVHLNMIKLDVPTNIEEQTKIGTYFQQLDTLIAQHQKKHDKLLNLKKALLEKLFPKQGATEPEIRFKGFSGAWEDKVFGGCFTNIPSNTLSRADMNYETGLAKNIHYGDVLIKFGEVLDVEKENLPFITDNKLAFKLKPGTLQDGDVIIADAAEDETVGKCTEVFNVKEQTVFAGLHTIAVRPVLLFATQYLGYYLNSSSYHTQLLPLMQGTKVLSISKTTIKTTRITFPSSSTEQTKIGNLFKQLDTLITQHQAQLKKLNNIKQACLEKMFV